MLKGLLGLAIAVFLGVTGYEAWDYYVRVDHPQSLLTAENALATHDLVALGSVSIEHAVRLESVFPGTPDTESAAQPGLLANTLFARFQSAGIDPRRDLRHAVLALYLGGGEQPGYAVAVLGNFDKQRVLAGLQQEFEVTPAAGGQPDIWSIRKQNVDSCEWSQPWSLFVSRGLMVASDPQHMPALLERFRMRSAAARDLARWREFRDDQLAGLALFIPENVPNVGNRFVQQPVNHAREALDAFKEVYFGIGVSPLPFTARLDLMMAGDDAAAARTVATGWQAALNDSKQQWGEQMPTVARLHDAVQVSEENGALRVSAAVDKAWLEDAAGIPQEFMNLLFGGSHMSVSTPGATAAPQERLEENPYPFATEVSADNLPGYQAEPPFVPVADSVSGPFGIRLSAVELGEQDATGIALTVSATHRGIPNLGDGKQRVQLYIDSVTDAQGNELLREETCGRDRNGLPAAVDQTHFKNSLTGEKTVRLKPGVGQADVDRIRGHVELLLPINTETIRLASLDQQQVIDRDTMRVVVEQSASDTLSYKVYGDTRRVLALRGLNSAAQSLAGTSSVSGGFLFGEGLSASRSFAGQVASAELVLASGDVEKSFAFELDGARPRTSQNESQHPAVQVATYSLAQLQSDFSTAPELPAQADDIKADTSAGPFRVALDRMQSFFGLQTGLKVYAPQIPGLSDNLGALELEVSAIENAAGDNLIATAPQSSPLQLSEDWQDQSRLQGQVNLQFETRAPIADVRKVRGELHLRLPQKIAPVTIDSMNVGTSVGEGDKRITLKRIDERGFSLDFGAQRPALVAVNAYNAQGDSLWMPQPQVERKGDRWIGRFDVSGSAAKVELLRAEEQEQKTFPFELSLR
ncbi:MAG: hypothetical protein PVJ83_09320 [Gammaproteobacteria bacterium]|jgi:hypothetical protein